MRNRRRTVAPFNTFSSPEAALLLVSTKNHDRPLATLWPGPAPDVRDLRTSRHFAHDQSQVWQIWLVLVLQSHSKPESHWTYPEVVSRGRDSWCWPMDENGCFKEGKLLQIQNERLKQTRHSRPHLVLGLVYLVAADSFWVSSTPDRNSRKRTTRKQIVTGIVPRMKQVFE